MSNGKRSGVGPCPGACPKVSLACASGEDTTGAATGLMRAHSPSQQNEQHTRSLKENLDMSGVGSKNAIKVFTKVGMGPLAAQAGNMAVTKEKKLRVQDENIAVKSPRAKLSATRTIHPKNSSNKIIGNMLNISIFWWIAILFLQHNSQEIAEVKTMTNFPEQNHEEERTSSKTESIDKEKNESRNETKNNVGEPPPLKGENSSYQK